MYAREKTVRKWLLLNQQEAREHFHLISLDKMSNEMCQDEGDNINTTIANIIQKYKNI